MNSNALTAKVMSTELPGEPQGSLEDVVPVPTTVLLYAVAMTIFTTRAEYRPAYSEW